MSTSQLPEHLQPRESDRGFVHMRPIESAYGGNVFAYESSAATEQRIWLRVTSPVDLNDPLGEWQEGVAHLEAEDAWKLAEQLMTLVENHYQGDARPPIENRVYDRRDQ